MDHQPTPKRDHHHPHERPGSPDRRHFLDLDAEVFGDHLAAVLDEIDLPLARGIVDLGAGTGAGSRLLRNRYPDAAVTCVDNDPEMLAMLGAQGFAVLEANLDDGFPAVTEAPVDLVWASSSLHHLAHPAQLLWGVRQALAPGGVLVVVELASLPCFFSDPNAALIEQRCHAAASAEGWNRHPDWAPLIEAAGFVVTKSEVMDLAPVTPAAREYAQQWIARFLNLATLTADERNAVEDLLERCIDVELEPRATRSVWVATSDQTPEKS